MSQLLSHMESLVMPRKLFVETREIEEWFVQTLAETFNVRDWQPHTRLRWMMAFLLQQKEYVCVKPVDWVTWIDLTNYGKIQEWEADKKRVRETLGCRRADSLSEFFERILRCQNSSEHAREWLALSFAFVSSSSGHHSHHNLFLSVWSLQNKALKEINSFFLFIYNFRVHSCTLDNGIDIIENERRGYISELPVRLSFFLCFLPFAGTSFLLIHLLPCDACHSTTDYSRNFLWSRQEEVLLGNNENDFDRWSPLLFILSSSRSVILPWLHIEQKFFSCSFLFVLLKTITHSWFASDMHICQ